MLVQATGLALLAALSPTALLIAAVYLGSTRPRLVTAFYLAGAVVMSLIMAVVLLAALRGVNLQRPAEHEPRYGLRLILGILLLAPGDHGGRPIRPRRTRGSRQGWWPTRHRGARSSSAS